VARFRVPIVQADTARIVEVYRRSGRFDVVSSQDHQLRTIGSDLVFEITRRKDWRQADRVRRQPLLFVISLRTSSNLETGCCSHSCRPAIFTILTGSRADPQLLRRFYLKHGFIDVRIVSALAEYDPNRRGFVVTFTIDEASNIALGQWTFSRRSGRSIRHCLGEAACLSGRRLQCRGGRKTVEDMTIEASRQGFAFATVRPSATRDAPTYTVNLLFTVSEGQRAYIERINIRGIRARALRDPTRISTWRKAMPTIARWSSAERRPQDLSYFKSVKISAEPARLLIGSFSTWTSRRQATGEFSGVGRLFDRGRIYGEVSVAERTCSAAGCSEGSVQYGQYTKASRLLRGSLLPSVIAWHGVSTPSTGNSFRQLRSRTRRIRRLCHTARLHVCAKTSPYSCDIRSISRKSYWRD